MDYVITNPTNKIFIRLDSKGSPQTCVSQMAQRFEFSKAKNKAKYTDIIRKEGLIYVKKRQKLQNSA